MKQVIVDTAAAPELWKKGQLHCHTLWSDGRSFPEEAVWAYKQLGFDFVCLSDHNVFQDKDDAWLGLRGEEGHWPPNATWEAYERLCKIFDKDICRTRQFSYRFFVRLNTYAELERRFNEPGKFTLIPGSELTMHFRDKDNLLHDIHANAVNIAEDILPVEGIDYKEAIRSHYEQYRKVADRTTHPTFFMMNHPWWRNWDYLPQDMLENPQVNHFEICNSGTYEGDLKCHAIMSPDKFWDVVLAHRIEDGLPPLYGTGSDDTHYYQLDNEEHPGSQGSAWVNVRVDGELTPDHITEALNRGDYYASSGAALNRVEYDTDTRELHVEVKAEPGAKYRIEFYATKRGFDRSYTTEYLEHPTRKELSRNMPRYSEEIGRLVTVVEGTEATCAANADDLYIRAKVISDIPASKIYDTRDAHPRQLTAWTQPVVVK